VQKPIMLFSAVGLMLLTLASCKPKNDITQDELLRRTQELFNAVSAGDQTPGKSTSPRTACTSTKKAGT